MEDPISGAGIDHVEVTVSALDAALEWYSAVLGLIPRDELADWANADGPLFCSNDGGATNLAFFEGNPHAETRLSGYTRVAFRVSGAAFLAFLQRSPDPPVYDEAGNRMDALEPVDHDLSFSTYFCDPDGNRLEVTTYEYEKVVRHIE